MSLQKMPIDGVMYDVMSWEEYWQNPSMNQYAAINIGNGYVYPVKKYDPNGENTRPGMYVTTPFSSFVDPVTDHDKDAYSDSHIIDFGAAENMREYIMTKQRLANAERAILTSIDNVFIPEISENDTPEMIALKQAIINKSIDLDKYEPRFGPNYNNDKRLLKKNNITFGKMRAMCRALDIKATITFEDANPDVPNPIGKVITAELTGDAMNVEEDNKDDEST